MSVPSAAMSMGAMAQMPSPLDVLFMSINSNPYFIGLMMLLLNLGGRFVAMEMTQSQERFFQNPWVRRLLIFTIIFVGTRNVVVAFIMSAIIILCLGYLFNENSSLCIYKAGLPGSTCAEQKLVQPFTAANNAMPMIAAQMSKEEMEILNKLSEKYKKLQVGNQEPVRAYLNPAVTTEISSMYFRNMSALQNGS